LPALGPEGKKSRNLAIGLLIIALLPMLVGVIIGVNLLSGPSGGPANTTALTPVATTIPAQVPQTPRFTAITTPSIPEPAQVQIPLTGVWVRVSYPGTYTGLVGTTGIQREVSDTGDNLYPIPSNARTVTASLEKEDGSGDQILLEVYKDGVLLRRESSITPNGIVEIQLDLDIL
jgi:hypothetical protein